MLITDYTQRTAGLTSGDFYIIQNVTDGVNECVSAPGSWKNKTGEMTIANLSPGHNLNIKNTNSGGSLQTAIICSPDLNQVTVNGFFNIPLIGTIVISSDAITPNGSHYRIDTEGAAATDELRTINGGSVGDIIILHSSSVSRVITIKNGAGNIYCGSDRALVSSNQTAIFIKMSINWCMFALI